MTYSQLRFLPGKLGPHGLCTHPLATWPAPATRLGTHRCGPARGTAERTWSALKPHRDPLNTHCQRYRRIVSALPEVLHSPLRVSWNTMTRSS